MICNGGIRMISRLKRFLSFAAAAAMCAAVMVGCGDSEKATITKDDSSSESASETAVSSKIQQSGVTEVTELEGEKSRINSYMDIVNAGTFTLKGTLTNKSMGLVTENPLTISVLDSSSYYYNVITVAANQEYIISDGSVYVLNANDSTYAESETKTADSIKNGISTYLPSLTTLTYLDTYEVEYNDSDYIRERYELKNNVGEEQTVSYFFDGDELEIIRYDSNVLETVIQSDLSVSSFENTADEDVFKIPDGYEKITETELEQNKNNTASSSEYIAALLDSLGITDERLEEMGYTREQVLNLSEQEQTVFIAKLFGEDYS